MRIIEPSFTIEQRDEARGNMAMIERAGRTCYKSEDKTSDGSAEGFVSGLIRRKHTAMLEHGDYIFMVEDPKIYDNIVCALQIQRDMTGKAPMLSTTIDVLHRERPIISGNVRAWRELVETGSMAAGYFAPLIDSAYIGDIVYPECDTHPAVHRILYDDLITPLERRAHLRQTVRFIIDRGVSHEFVRHRVMSFSQESTRYCNYSKGQFGGQVTFIKPCYLAPDTKAYQLWECACQFAENSYFAELGEGLSPQEARAVLPNSVKTELVMTGTLGQWDMFFDLRARQVTGKAHPQAVEVALPLMQEMHRRFSDVIRGD